MSIGGFSLPKQQLASLSPYYFSAALRLRIFYACSAATTALFYYIYQLDTSGEARLGAILIVTVALIPLFVWLVTGVPGMPIFQLYILSYIWTCGLPLAVGTNIEMFPPADCLRAALKITAFIVTATLSWGCFAFTKVSPPSSCYLLNVDSKTFKLLLAIMPLNTLCFMANIGGWWTFLPRAVISPLQTATSLPQLMAAFVLWYSYAQNKLTRSQARLFIGVFSISLVVTPMTLLLAPALSLSCISLAGYFLGAKKVPITAILILLIVTTVLNMGKTEMRTKYWPGGDEFYIQVFENPAYYHEWLLKGLQEYRKTHFKVQSTYSYNAGRVKGKARDATNSLINRADSIYLLLKVQSLAPTQIPYLYGRTYSYVPGILMPRFIYPSKPTVHDATNLLNLHFGFQRPGDNSTFGWGLLNESYGNFGLRGCIALGILLGGFLGGVSYWSVFTPLLSARGIFAVGVLGTSMNSLEWNAAMYTQNIVHSMLAVALLTSVLMKKHSLFSPAAQNRPISKASNDLSPRIAPRTN